MKVLVRGGVSVYEASGQYQLYVEDMRPEGIGALNLALSNLKQKLERKLDFLRRESGRFLHFRPGLE